VVAPERDVLAEMATGFHGAWAFLLHGITGPAVWLSAAGFGVAWLFYSYRPDLPGVLAKRLRWPYQLLANKYYLDEFNASVFAGGFRGIGRLFWRVGDERLIDGLMVNGSARLMGWSAGVMRHMQSGYLYHYAFAMIIGLSLLLGYFIFV
ncbi:MAG TPA: NADH-quinone oxidoreductase subunit L, partial [Gammaproteobacteria bacterium]|nr:NADH-quinone oxidoreductase subunit L [Gammaproteobacteria bacterium]